MKKLFLDIEEVRGEETKKSSFSTLETILFSMAIVLSIVVGCFELSLGNYVTTTLLGIIAVVLSCWLVSSDWTERKC